MYRSVLAKAIHSLSRIGDELYVEPQDDGVSYSHTHTQTDRKHQNFLLCCIDLVASCWCMMCFTE